ncbi:MAG: protein-arginine deiminase family protein [Planctomycetota bacterium]|jgi:hypothetical protein
MLAEGLNDLVATVTDADGNFQQSKATPVFLDTTAPEVEILLPHRMASGHLRDAEGRPVLVAGPADIERVRGTDSAVSHRTKRNVIGWGTPWRIKTAEDCAPITSFKILSTPADPDDGNPVPPLPPSAWDYLNMPLEAHPSPGVVPESGGTGPDFPPEPGTHTVASPLGSLLEGQYWIIAEVENAAGGKTRVGGLVYLDKSAPDENSAGGMPGYGLDADAVELSINGSTANTHGYAERPASDGSTAWSVYPQLDFPEPTGYGRDNGGLPEPAWRTVALRVKDYAGNQYAYDNDAYWSWATDMFRAACMTPTANDNWYFGFENAWSYDEETSWWHFLHYTQDGELTFTYEDQSGEDVKLTWHMVPGTIGVRIDGVVSPSGAGIVPAPPVWPVDGSLPEDVEVSLFGDFLHSGLLDLSGAYGRLKLSSQETGSYSKVVVAEGTQATAATDGSGPGEDDVVAFEGKWVPDDPEAGDRAYRQAAGWESVDAEFWGASSENEIEVHLDTTRPGMLNVVRAGPSVMATGTRTVLRIVAGGLEDVDPNSVQVWLRKDGAEIPEGPNTYSRATDDAGTVIPARVVTFDLANARRYKALEIDLDLSPNLDVGVYDVEVKAGDVIAVNSYKSDSVMGPRWHGPNDGLVIERALNALGLDLDVDTDRDGIVEKESDEDNEAEFSRQRGAVVLFNSDDDDDDDKRDCSDSVVQGGGDSDDLARLVIQYTDLPSDENVFPALKIPADLVGEGKLCRARIFDSPWAGGTVLLGPEEGVVVGEYKYKVLDRGWLLLGIDLGVEAVSPITPDFDGGIEITLEWIRKKADGNWDYASPLASDTVRLQVAPSVLTWNGQPAEYIYASRLVDDEIRSNVTGITVNEEYWYGKWLQDYGEIAHSWKDAATGMPVLVDLNHPEDYDWPTDTVYYENIYGYHFAHLNGNGGAIECTPPLGEHELGLMVISEGRDQKIDEARHFFDSQKVQLDSAGVPVEIDTKWLDVGHTDEVVCFLPHGESYAVLVPSPAEALNTIFDLISLAKGNSTIWVGTQKDSELDDEELKTIMDLAVADGASLASDLSATSTSVTLTSAVTADVGSLIRVDNEYMLVQSGGGTNTLVVTRGAAKTEKLPHLTGEIAFVLTELAAYNLVLAPTVTHCPQDELDSIVSDVLVRDLGVPPSQIKRMPVLYKYRAPSKFAAYTSNVVNCLVVQGKTIMPKTWGPVSGGIDWFQYRINLALTGIATPVFIDAWSCHLSCGEVHCATNVRRSRTGMADWWDAWPDF